MNRRRRRRPQVYEYEWPPNCFLKITVRSGKVLPTLSGDLRKVSPGDRERVADVLSKWTGESHDDCYSWCWEGIPRCADVARDEH